MALGAADRWIETNGIRMHCLDWTGGLASPGGPGTATAGPVPIVALHGLASSAHWYDLTLPDLALHYPTYALDQRAHGLTDQPPTGYDWGTLAHDVAGALDSLRLERAALLGHSWGASTALATAIEHPERVARLVLIDGGFFSRAQSLTWEEYKQRLRPRDIYGPRERYVGALRSEFAHVWTDDLERIVMSMPRIDPDGTVWERLEPANHEQVLRAMYHAPLSDRYQEVRCPTLIVAAAPLETPQNAAFQQRRKEMAAAAQRAIPDCRVHWVQGSGHDIGYEKPRELAEVIHRFLSEETGSV
jgi:pimeloyl-ACP methyl ester carboxylesterase